MIVGPGVGLYPVKPGERVFVSDRHRTAFKRFSLLALVSTVAGVELSARMHRYRVLGTLGIASFCVSLCSIAGAGTAYYLNCKKRMALQTAPQSIRNYTVNDVK